MCVTTCTGGTDSDDEVQIVAEYAPQTHDTLRTVNTEERSDVKDIMIMYYYFKNGEVRADLCVCVCVCVRERERERGTASACVRVCVRCAMLSLHLA